MVPLIAPPFFALCAFSVVTHSVLLVLASAFLALCALKGAEDDERGPESVHHRVELAEHALVLDGRVCSVLSIRCVRSELAFMVLELDASVGTSTFTFVPRRSNEETIAALLHAHERAFRATARSHATGAEPSGPYRSAPLTPEWIPPRIIHCGAHLSQPTVDTRNNGPRLSSPHIASRLGRPPGI